MRMLLLLLMELLCLGCEHVGRSESRRSKLSGTRIGYGSTGTGSVGGWRRLIEARGPTPSVYLSPWVGVGSCKWVVGCGTGLLRRRIGSDKVVTCSSSDRAAHAR